MGMTTPRVDGLEGVLKSHHGAVGSAAVTTFTVRSAVMKRTSRHKPWMVLLLLFSVDLSALVVSFGIPILTWNLNHEQFPAAFYLQKWPVLAMFLAAYWAAGLYRVVGLSPVEEMRRLVLATTAGGFFLICLIFLAKESVQYSRGVIALAWLLAVILIPVVRLTLRPLVGKRDWFAQPAAILGAGQTAARVIKTLRRNPGLGLRPVVVFDDNPAQHRRLTGVPVIAGLTSAASFCRSAGIDYAILTTPGLSRESLLKVVRHAAFAFSNLLLVPNLFGVSSLWVRARDLGGILGLEIRDNLLKPGVLRLKRLLDLALIVFSLPIWLPISLLLTLLVKLSSEGPVFYAQKRIGKDGKVIQVLKFRTMVKNADAVLQKHLEENPHFWNEWRKDQKLKRDPRITWVGQLLRRTSLDELPQLWNVVHGEMSLVGPRPIVEAEIEKFGNTWDLYTRVLPGITGLWQVSGRNNLTYSERVHLNEYYVRNWSIWLDLYILFKTTRVVFTGHGAY
jgi:Undecaprenyl-phosphate galactose phosphotransferase WbaP